MGIITTAKTILTEEEIKEICRPLQQSAAQVRYLKRLGLNVSRKPNGHPLVARAELDRAMAARPITAANDPAPAAPNTAGLAEFFRQRGRNHGTKAQAC
ncbi:MAG: DUF4224 domain-containing protein [Burkholderiaceae bacterium]|nr:DUF4224 domain-containing protein [Burkholderiaceae bacterium]